MDQAGNRNPEQMPGSTVIKKEQKTKDLYCGLVEGIPDLLMRFDPEGRTLFVSENIRDFFELKTPLSAAKTPGELGFPEELCVKWDRSIREVCAGGKRREIEYSLSGKKCLAWFNMILVPEFSEEGKVESVLSVSRDITKYKKSLQQMIESQFCLKKAQEIGMIGHFSYDPASGLIEGSDEFFYIFDIDSSAPLFKSFVDALHPKDANLVIPCIDKAVKHGIPYDIEHRVCRRNGEILFVHGRGEMIDTPEGRRMVSIVQDITERKKIEKTLQENERKLKEAQEIAHLGYWTWDVRTGAVEWSEEVYKIFQLDPKTFTPQIDSILELSPWPEDHKRDKELINRAIENHRAGFYEQRFLRPDKSVGYYYSNFEGRYNKKGELISIVGTVMDITERKRIEEALIHEKERLSVTLRSIGDGVITTDTTGAVVLMNKVAENLTGWKQEDDRGKPLETVFRIINEITRKPCENPVSKVLSSGSVVELSNHTLLISKDGAERKIADSGAPIKDNSGAIIGIVLVFRDVTEKQKLLETVQRAEKLESLGILAGGIAHDFNNLLGGILGNIDIALHIPDPKQAASHLESALATITRARGLTRQLLTFSKGGSPVKTTEKLNLFLEETVRFALSGSRVNVSFDIAEDLWPCDMDRNQICQVIDNMTINARQAMEEGGALKVAAKNRVIDSGNHQSLRDGQYIEIFFTDTGPGIPREILDKIFDPFFSTKAGGHGLGLPTCYSIIAKHDGWIEVESHPGKGSVFHFFLPASQGKKIENGTEPVKRHQGLGTFLVMDDEPLICRLVCAMLDSMGYSAISKKNGEEALAFFREERAAGRRIAGMLFDLTIKGGMGGSEAVLEVRKLDREVPVFVSSGYAEDPVMARPCDHGFTASLGKPFLRKELVNLLNQYMPVRNENKPE